MRPSFRINKNYMAKYCPEKQNYALYLDCQECESHMCEAFFCIVIGSRSFTDYELMSAKLDHLLQNHSKVVIISGGAKGADALAERYAKEHDMPVIVFPAKWEELGKMAGYIRNKEMHEFASKMPKRGCIAFWDGKSKGTQHSFKIARECNTPIKIIKTTK